MISIQKITDKAGIKQFVRFPFSLYKDDKNWVPPLIKEEMGQFDPTQNPVLEQADLDLYLAFRDNKLVGRIAVIINWQEVNHQNIRKLRFGWLDFIDDKAVSKALLDKAVETAKAKGLDYVEGPMGFSNMDKVGVQIEGFEHGGSMATWYNFPYYAEHLKHWGYSVEKEYVETRFATDNIKNAAVYTKAAGMVEKRYGLRALNFTSTKQIEPYVHKMFDLFNTSYASLPSFVAVSDKQKEYFKNKYLPLTNPQMIKFVVDEKGKLVAFSIVLPSFSEALKKAKGKLFPLGFLHLLRAKKKSDTVLFYLIGILPEYQSKGVTAIIFHEYYKTFSELGVKTCIQTPELAINKSVLNLWKHFDPNVFARRNTYRLDVVD